MRMKRSKEKCEFCGDWQDYCYNFENKFYCGLSCVYEKGYNDGLKRGKEK